MAWVSVEAWITWLSVLDWGSWGLGGGGSVLNNNTSFIEVNSVVISKSKVSFSGTWDNNTSNKVVQTNLTLGVIVSLIIDDQVGVSAIFLDGESLDFLGVEQQRSWEGSQHVVHADVQVQSDGAGGAGISDWL